MRVKVHRWESLLLKILLIYKNCAYSRQLCAYLRLTFLNFNLTPNFLVQNKELKRYFSVVCRFNFDRLQFLHPHEWRQDLSVLSASERCKTNKLDRNLGIQLGTYGRTMFNIRFHKTESSQCKMCVSVKEKKRKWGWLRIQWSIDRKNKRKMQLIHFHITFKSHFCLPTQFSPDTESVLRLCFLSGGLALAFDLQVLIYCICTLSYYSALLDQLCPCKLSVW